MPEPIIFDPIQDLLVENELMFVPEGPLCLTPFRVFKAPNSKYLCESFRIRCHSAHGEIKAEGVVGIARAFLGAGARSVLVSLWAIDDKATLEFMKIFYQHLVKGKSASEALNQAMNCMRESEEFGAVKY